MLLLVLVVGLICYHVYKSIKPPPPIPLPENVSEICPRVKLNDGRYLAYRELGFPKDKAKNKIIILHGFGSSKLVDLKITQEMIDEFEIYFLFFDRAGYGESDAHPSRTVKTDTYDIEELAEKLQIGPKFHVLGMSLGAYPVYGCLKYIPHRLSGATLVVPLLNFWWSSMPQSLLSAALKKLPIQNQWTFRVAHYLPWLLYWWLTQKWFSPFSPNPRETMTERDIELADKHTKHSYIKESALRQGEYVSTHRDIIASFENWEFDPTELLNPFSDGNEGSVHMWCALEDKQILREALLYICDKLPWIKLRQVPETGHLIIHEKQHFEDIIKTACYHVYKSIKPPPPIPLPENVSEICSRIKLNDGRYLAYRELGFPKDKAKNKIIIIHGYGSSKLVDLKITQEMIDEFEIYFLLFDRAGYGESDAHPSRTIKTDTYDIEELADKLQIGPKFHVLGILSGATFVAPLLNFWWSRMPQNLLSAALKKLPIENQWTFRVAHYLPWLLYWWLTQKWFSPFNLNPLTTMTERDIELADKHTKHSYIKESALRQGEYVSMQRDIIASFENWEFDPTELLNPFSDGNEGSVHIWCALEDKQILREALLYICDKLPWIKLHQVPEAGHLIIHEKQHFEDIIKTACS
uniref:AB hydrolase-1 domain-containing protein n=1 Tax=Brassica campestris TaxID=3711 RepID=A0A3P5ZMY2_BRACM|nr:unnamed protein product [Brassica rapa]